MTRWLARAASRARIVPPLEYAPGPGIAPRVARLSGGQLGARSGLCPEGCPRFWAADWGPALDDRATGTPPREPSANGLFAQGPSPWAVL